MDPFNTYSKDCTPSLPTTGGSVAPKDGESSLQKLEAQLADVQQVYMGGLTHSTVQNAIQRLEQKARGSSGDYRSIFQSAFKNLEDHVIDVQSCPGNKYHRANLQRHRRPSSCKHISSGDLVIPVPTRSQPDPRCYPQELQSSLQVFQIRKGRPLTASYRSLTPSGVRRPASDRPRSSPATHRPVPPEKTWPDLQKKHDQQESLWYPPWLPKPQEYSALGQSLSTNIFSYVGNGHRSLMPTLNYGDISKQTANKGTLTEESAEGNTVLSENLSSTSGVDSDGGISDAAVDKASRDDLDTDSTSGVDKGNNPLDDLMLQLSVLDLRPEKMDPTDTPEIKCFDFSLRNLENPVYEFKCPVPVPLDSVDVRLHAKENSDRRVAYSDCETVDPVVSAMFDRLVELGRLQVETQEWEEGRVRLMRKRPVSRCNKLPDKRGCSVCLRPGCAGSCSSKRAEATCCERCHQPLGNGACRNNKCDLRTRQWGDDRRTNSSSTPQQTCKPGEKQMDTGQFASRVLKGRPKTAAAVVSRGRSISKCRQLRPTSVSTSGYLSKEAQRLGLEPPRSKAHSNNRLTVPRKNDEQIPSRASISRTDVSSQPHSSSRTKQQGQRQTDRLVSLTDQV